MAIIKLKRTRNSLLNISKLPPELLGDIFCWNASPTSDFLGWEDRSHSFLLVCHHWFKVASCTPDLWSFWGTTPKEWKRCCHHSGAAPLDLVLDVYGSDHPFDSTFGWLKVLQDRATRDTIRRVRLKAGDPYLLGFIIHSLTVDREGLQSNSIESFIFLNESKMLVSLSGFFNRYRFPKLQHLEITGHITAQWGYLSTRTGALTTLTLGSRFPSSIPTTSELLSILAFNPALRKVSVSVIPAPDGNKSSFRVPLHQLKQLDLSGDVRDAAGVLHRLDHPGEIVLNLRLYECTAVDITQVIGPYLRDHIGRRRMPQNGLGLFLSQREDTIEHNVGNVVNLDPSASEWDLAEWDLVTWFLSVEIYLNATPSKDLLEQAFLDLLAHTPQEEVVYFHAYPMALEVLSVSTQFLNAKVLRFDYTPISALPNLGDREIFRSLQCVLLEQVVVDDDDWSPLTTSLARRASSGNQLDALEIFGYPRMCKEVADDIRSMVRHFRSDNPGL